MAERNVENTAAPRAETEDLLLMAGPGEGFPGVRSPCGDHSQELVEHIVAEVRKVVLGTAPLKGSILEQVADAAYNNNGVATSLCEACGMVVSADMVYILSVEFGHTFEGSELRIGDAVVALLRARLNDVSGAGLMLGPSSLLARPFPGAVPLSSVASCPAALPENTDPARGYLSEWANSPASEAARILMRCTEPEGGGHADLSHLPHLPGLALDRWLEQDGMEALKNQICCGLRSLNLNGIAAIDRLPQLVASFSCLTSISLLRTRLTKFPPELCELKGLQSLAVGKQGRLFKLAMQGCLERLGALDSLIELKLKDVGLTELSWEGLSNNAPPWPRLQTIHVDDNNLAELPSWLTHLTQLQELDVSGNQLRCLPDFDPNRSRREELTGQLDKLGISQSDTKDLLESQGVQHPPPLRALFVQRNFLDELPVSLAGLRDTLKTLVANPQKSGEGSGAGVLRTLRVPPEEVLAKSTDAVLGFLGALRDNGLQTRTLMRVSFVGEGGAGKTHLCLALQGELERYRHDDPETVGIETGSWVARSDDGSKAPVFCRSWDFEGQASYRAVHQFFFTKGRSLYLLVVDLTTVLHLRNEALKQALLERMIFWVKSLQARAPGAIVKVVLTKADSIPAERRTALLEARELVRSCLQELVMGSLEVLRTERDMLKAMKGGRGMAGDTRLAELEAAIESGGLHIPESAAEILVLGIPPEERGSEEDANGQDREAESERGSDRPDESVWEKVQPAPESIEVVQALSSSSGKTEQLAAPTAPLQAAIIDLAAANGAFTISFPANWVGLIDWVEGRPSGCRGLVEHATTGSVEWRDYARELSGEGKLFSSGKGLREATELLHDLGYFLYYGGDGDLGKHVFLHPQKVIDLLKVVVQHNFVEKVQYVASNNLVEMNLGGPGLFQRLASEFLREGKLDHRMLPQMWPGIADWSLHTALLELLERFDLAYCSEATIPDEDTWGSHGVPSRWPETPKQSVAALLPLAGTAVVSRRLHFDRLLPEGIFEQLLVRALGLEALALDQGRKAMWRSTQVWGSGACFDCEEDVCMFLLMARDPAAFCGDPGGARGGELPGNVFVLSWHSRGQSAELGGGEAAPRAVDAVRKLLAELVPLLRVRFPGVRFQEEVICHEHFWQQGWPDGDLIGAAAGEQLEADSALSFREVVSSIRGSTGWRSLRERRKRWRCGTCQKEHDISTFGSAFCASRPAADDVASTSVRQPECVVGLHVSPGEAVPTGVQPVGVTSETLGGLLVFPDTPTGVLDGPGGDARGMAASTPRQKRDFDFTSIERIGAQTLSRQPYPTVDWPYDVFISHAGPTKPLAVELEAELRALGFKAFVDRNALHPGDDADRRLVDTARSAPIGLVLFSKDFVVRTWPIAELRLIVEAGTLLPVVVGMSHAELKAAWRGSPETAGLEEGFFEQVMRTTFVDLVVEQGSWQKVLREKICFEVLRAFVEKVCPRLPNVAASMRHVERALSAARKVVEYRFLELSGRDYMAANQFVGHLENVYAGRVPFGTPLALSAYAG